MTVQTVSSALEGVLFCRVVASWAYHIDNWCTVVSYNQPVASDLKWQGHQTYTGTYKLGAKVNYGRFKGADGKNGGRGRKDG